MKNLDLNSKSMTETEVASSVDHIPALQMKIYNEMSDQPAQSVDVLQTIQNQFAEIQRLQIKKNYLLKEVSQYFKD